MKLNLHRHFNLWCYACLNLSRFKNRTLAVFTPLAIAMTLTAAITLIRNGFERDAKAAIRLLPDITVQKLVGGRAERMNTAEVNSFQVFPGLRKVAPRVWGYLPVSVNHQQFVLTLMGQNIESFSQYGAVQGKMPVAPGDCVIGEGVAKLLKVKPGQRLALKRYSGQAQIMSITGMLRSQAQIYGTDLIITSTETARCLLGYHADECSDIGVIVDHPLQMNAIAAALAKNYPELRIVSRNSLSAITQQAYGSRAGLFQLIWLMLLLTVLLTVWAQGTVLSTGISREVGVLKALGWTTGDVVTVKVWESLILGLTGTLTGLVGAMAYIRLGAPELRSFFLGWSAIFPETQIPVAVKPESIIAMVAIGVLPLLMVTITRIWRLGTTDPDEALRSSS